ncbi:MAG: hypothetical protein P1U56_02170 [Saprospiraceae bacterium]|nr:hypothetical protein [Saprospiraceae bacterium]
MKREISLRDFILLMKEYFFYLLKKWWLIGLISGPITLYFAYNAYVAPGMYSANTKFIIEEGNGNVNVIGGILGGFGIGKGGGVSNHVKVSEVALSNLMAEKILMSESQCGKKILANEIIEFYELDKKWAESDEKYANVRFANSNSADYTELERKVFRKITKVLIGTDIDRTEALMKFTRNDKSGVFKIKVSTEKECITQSIIDSAYDNLKQIFEEEILEVKVKMVEILTNKRDSLLTLIDQKSLNYARFRDRNRGSIYDEADYAGKKLLLEIQGLTTAYVESIKNLELADVNYRNSKPFFMILDKTFPPLGRYRPNLITKTILGAITGLFLAIIVLVGYKLLGDIMNEDTQVDV